MKLGVGLPQAGPEASPENIVRVAVEAERMGYDSVWVFERLLRPTRLFPAGAGGELVRLPELFANVYDPLEILAYVAAKTERIQLGTSVINALFHAPVVLARRFATLDHLSGGRVIAGLGQGGIEDEFETAGVSTKRRGKGFEEFITATHACWGPDPVSFYGSFYEVPESEIGPKPIQEGGVPIIVGGFVPPAIERAARISDGFNYGPPAGQSSWEKLEDTVQKFRDAARAAGRDPEVLQFVVRANVRIGEKALNEDRQPPLGGTPEQVHKDLQRAEELGVNHVFFDMSMVGVPLSDQLHSMELLMERLRG